MHVMRLTAPLLAAAAVAVAAPAAAAGDWEVARADGAPAAELELGASPLAADDECTAKPRAAPCALRVLQRRGARRTGSRPSPASEVPSQYEPHEPGGQNALDTPLGADQMGDAVRTLLEQKLSMLNEKIQAMIPEYIAEVYTSNGTDTVCCVRSPWSCWCHCDALGTVEVRNLTNVNTLNITRVRNVTTNFGDDVPWGSMGLSIDTDAEVEGISGRGVASGSLGACGLQLPTLHGGLGLEASVRGSVRLTGLMTMKQEVCFRCTSVEIAIPSDGVQYQRNTVSIGSWEVLQLHGSFWNRIVHHLPTEPLRRAVSRAAEEAIPAVLSRESFCL